MSKAGANKARVAKRGSSATKNSRAVDLAAVQQRIVNQVGNNAFDIVKTTVEELKKRSNLATLKYLFESIGLFPCPAVGQKNGEESSLTAVLLQRLGAPDGEAAQSEAVVDSGTEFVGAAGNAVE
ncbi:MAG TPA: hypothetical protein VFJ47_00015 [Terriglobales bacterium]|nr:hypothetical protein [Terriglobales bacterium]